MASSCSTICRPLWARSAARATPSSARILVIAARASWITGSIAGQSSRGSSSERDFSMMTPGNVSSDCGSSEIVQVAAGRVLFELPAVVFEHIGVDAKIVGGR